MLRAAFDAARMRDQSDTGGGGAEDAPTRAWDGGRYLGARWVPAHPGRVGKAIRPWAAVVHTTDMHPATFHALVKAWAAKPGAGNAAHFVLGRTPAEGLVQVVDVGRNANHAGGKPKHGWFKVDGKLVHPNACSVGIEVHNAGSLVRDAGQWRTWQRKDGGLRPFGAPIPAEDVEVDPKRPHRGWHLPTDWQLAELDRLLLALGDCPVVERRAGPVDLVPSGEAPEWAPRGYRGVPFVGHVTLDPLRKTDPGVPISRWLMARSGA